MLDNPAALGKPITQLKIPQEVLSSPALLFLYYRIEQILGIKAGTNALINLNDYIENNCGSSFIENPAAYEYLLTSREHIFNISKFLTVNETYFFRESEHFELLASFLPQLAELNRPINICCAAVSIGCEAYSIAMLIDYHIKNGLNIDFAIDAFDVNNDAIETAKNARYTPNAFRTDGASWKHILDLYLSPDDSETQEQYIVCENIRRKVRFFPHNIMRGLEKQYDIIFFRNAFIYFSFKNRHNVINNLAESLYTNGLLFLGISETSSVKHPLLVNRFTSNVFYFQKIENIDLFQKPLIKEDPIKPVVSKHKTNKTRQTKQTHIKKNENLPVYCHEIHNILKTDEGKTNAENVINWLEDKYTSSISGSCLAAASLFYLNNQDFVIADKIILILEKYNSSTYTYFLRGEYYFLLGIHDKAEKYYQEATVKDKTFWPAFYRIVVLASEGNQTRYEYKIKKTIESIELSKANQSSNEHFFECFLGGFSADYFLRILEKKLI